MNYITYGVCAKEINFDVVDDKVKNVSFSSGCPGNLLGISTLVEGMEIDKVISRLEGLKCGAKSTSCPDQLATALKTFKTQQ